MRTPWIRWSALCALALVVSLLAAAWLYAYKLRHPYTKADLVKARRDSVDKSRSVVSGKVQEHLAPLFPAFLNQFNPKDARFLGTPLDFIVFDGLDEGDVRRVVFVEVKTGKASLLSRERRCRDAIEAGRVEYQFLRLPADEIKAADEAPQQAIESAAAPAWSGAALVSPLTRAPSSDGP
jgi:predicted Holliday junction resolvase-like endonuclease